MTEKVKNGNEFERRDRRFGGLLLVAVGLLALLTNIAHFRDLGFLILPVLGACFLAWGFYTGRFGFTIPGCLLLGIGAGVVLTQTVVMPGSPESGGVVILGLAAGFLGISVIGLYFEQKRIWWPLIPGGILGVIGALMFFGDVGLNVLEWLGRVWPAILVVIGLYVLFAPRRQER
jgi:hypothetical protein